MPLPSKLKRYTFAICFGISLFPFVALNVAIYLLASSLGGCVFVVEVGFPLKWYVSNWNFQGVVWDAFVFDVMLVVTASLISAKILKSVLQPSD